MLKIMFDEKGFAGFEKASMKHLITEKGMKACAWMFEKPEIAGKEYFFITEETNDISSNLLTDKDGVVSLLMFLGDYSETELVGEIVKRAFTISRYQKDKIVEMSRNSGIDNTFKGGIERFLGDAIVRLNDKQSVMLIMNEEKDISDTVKWLEKSGIEIKKLNISLMKAGNEMFLLGGDEAALNTAVEKPVVENVSANNITVNNDEMIKLQEGLKNKEIEIEKQKQDMQLFEERLKIREKEIDEKKANLELVEKEMRERIENTISGKEPLDRKDSGDGKIKKQPIDAEEVAKNLKDILLQKDDYIVKTLKPFIKILSSKPKIFSRIEVGEELYSVGVGFNENDAMKKLDRIVDHLIKEPNKYIDKVVEFEVLVKGNQEYGDNFSIVIDYRDTVKRVMKEL